MKFKLYFSLNTDMVDAEEYHLDDFPTIQEFLALDNRILRQVEFGALYDLLPLLKHKLLQEGGAGFRPDTYVKWNMEGELGGPVYFAVRVL